MTGEVRKERGFRKTLQKELKEIQKKEASLRKRADRGKKDSWKQSLEQRIPEKAMTRLEKAFATAFSLVFEKGTGVIEKSYRKERLEEMYAVRDFAVQKTRSRKSLKELKRGAASTHRKNLAVTTAEGVGLGTLGIGLPDIVVFVSVLLKGIYETALQYGFDYESPEERALILKMMEGALARQEDWVRVNDEVDRLLLQETLPGAEPEQLREQMERTAKAFSLDMLLLKFLQGIPVVGILGGMGNPVYYQKVMGYVQLKYRKRYLLKQRCQSK